MEDKEKAVQALLSLNSFEMKSKTSVTSSDSEEWEDDARTKLHHFHSAKVCTFLIGFH